MKIRRDHWTESASAVVLLPGIVVLPMLWIVGYSVLYSFGLPGRLGSGWTISHWQAALGNLHVGTSLIYSAVLAGCIVLFGTIFALGLCGLLHDLRRHRIVVILLSLPAVTPSVVVAMIVLQWLNPGGLLARIAFHVGMVSSTADFPVLVQDRWGFGICVAGLFSVVPLMTLIFLRIWDVAKIDRYLMLAEALGASRMLAMFRIAVPMLLSRSRAMILYVFLVQFGSFEVPLLLGRQFPETISVLAHRRSGQFDLLQRPQAFVVASAYMVVVVGGMMMLQKLRSRRDQSA